MKPTKNSDYRHIEQTYDEGSRAYSDYHRTPHEYIEEDRQRFIDRLPVGSTILDCGCGPGIDTERFCRLGYKVTAIDLSDRFVGFTRKRVPSACVLKMDMRYLKFADASFDGLWSSFSLLHIRESDIKKTFSGFKSVLRHGGLLFAALHRGPKTDWVKTPIAGLELETYVQEWTQTDIEAALRSSGFEIILSRPFERKGGRYPLLSILANKQV